jgi:hypothetical protein
MCQALGLQPGIKETKILILLVLTIIFVCVNWGRGRGTESWFKKKELKQKKAWHGCSSL